MPRERKLPAETKRVGIWIRVSTEDQARGESPEAHEQRARSYAEQRAWKVVELYNLAGVSGKDVRSHPECDRMMEDIRRHHITGLIFSKLARLARNTKQLLEFAEFFKANDADLISLADSIDTSTPAGRLFYTMNAAVAQWEREEIAERTAVSVAMRAKMGKMLKAKAPFGYRWEGQQLRIDETEAPIRRLVFELFAEHKRKKLVARLLNDAGHRMRGGYLFCDTTIKRLLNDPVSKGLRRQNVRSGRTGIKPPSEWAYVEVPAVVSEELWNACQEILTSQNHPKHKPAKKTVTLFAGFVHCGSCGRRMYVPSRYHAYNCPMGCKIHVMMDDLEAVFVEQIKGFFSSSALIQEHLEKADAGLEGKRRLLTSLQTEKDQVSSEIDKLFRLYNEDLISGNLFASRNKPLEGRFQQLEDEIPRLSAEVDFQRLQLLSSSEIITEAQDLYSRWPKFSFEQKRSIIETLIDRITITQNEIAIDLAYAPSPSRPPPKDVSKRQRTPWSAPS